MKFDSFLTDVVVLREIGARLKHKRVDSGLTQAQLAEQAGIAKRTVERLESGNSTDCAAPDGCAGCSEKSAGAWSASADWTIAPPRTTFG